jgi:hypothetical protein
MEIWRLSAYIEPLHAHRFNPRRFEDDAKAILFDRSTGFLVRPPRIDAKPTKIVPRPGTEDEDMDERDTPF